MPEALASKDDDWLVGEMSSAVCWMDKSPRKTKSGITMVNYNKQDALERLCFGEFNIAYIRGLARALFARGETTCLVYRADPAYVPRAECSSWEGQTFPLADVIAGHRARYFPRQVIKWRSPFPVDLTAITASEPSSHRRWLLQHSRDHLVSPNESGRLGSAQ